MFSLTDRVDYEHYQDAQPRAHPSRRTSKTLRGNPDLMLSTPKPAVTEMGKGELFAIGLILHANCADSSNLNQQKT